MLRHLEHAGNAPLYARKFRHYLRRFASPPSPASSIPRQWHPRLGPGTASRRSSNATCKRRRRTAMVDEARVRDLAHKIWESEGRPEGQEQRHWDMALEIVTAEREEGVDVELEEVGEPVDEPPILEDDLPLEDDEIGIQENRLDRKSVV